VFVCVLASSVRRLHFTVTQIIAPADVFTGSYCLDGRQTMPRTPDCSSTECRTISAVLPYALPTKQNIN